VAEHIFVTCWHCVAEKPEGQKLAAVMEKPDGGYKACWLENVAQDANGSDLATATILTDVPTRLNLALSRTAAASGADVLAWGYPLTEENVSDTGRSFHLQARYLQGYVTRGFWHEHPRYGRTPCYEVDMPIPEGLSGAPLIRVPALGAPVAGRPLVVGVVSGRIEVGAIDQFSTIDPATGERSPEVQRLVSFAIAGLHVDASQSHRSCDVR
jgi:hypothetical protein